MAACDPVPCVNTSSSDPNVKIANPMLYSFTRPNMSEMRPKVTSRVAVTTIYPIRIQSRNPELPGESGMIAMPRNIAGREISRMLLLIVATKVPIVVFDSTIHL